MDKGSSDGGERQIPTAGDADEFVWKGGSSGVDRDKPTRIKTIQPVSSVGGLLGLEVRF
jgi:hypothetical protein